MINQSKSAFCFCFLFFLISLEAQDIIVSSTADAGDGTLRAAIDAANERDGGDVILFQIPINDVNFDADQGVWRIVLESELPALLDDNTFIDGNSQVNFAGETNTEGPEIVLDGSQIDVNAINILSSDNTISGLVIQHFSTGINISGGSANKIFGNYIGVNARGDTLASNGTGVYLLGDSKFNQIGGPGENQTNVISGNTLIGVYLFGEEVDSNTIQGNFIGVDKTGMNPLGNSIGGVYFRNGPDANYIGGASEGMGNIISGSNKKGNIFTGNGITLWVSNNNIVQGNLIGINREATDTIGNAFSGIGLYDSRNNLIGGEGMASNIIGGNSLGIFMSLAETTGNNIKHNFIGTDSNQINELGNKSDGIALSFGPKINTIGPGNVIANNNGSAVNIQHDSTNRIKITQNYIYNNGADIILKGGANLDILRPEIEKYTDSLILGNACPNCMVEIFSDSQNVYSIYEGVVQANDNGNFEWQGPVQGPGIHAVAIDEMGNTSAFSEAILTGVEDYQFSHSTIKFWQNYPNPFRTSTMIRFQIAFPGYTTIRIYNSIGTNIKTLVQQKLPAGIHEFYWDGNNQFGNVINPGLYFCELVNGRDRAFQKMIFSGR